MFANRFRHSLTLLCTLFLLASFDTVLAEESPGSKIATQLKQTLNTLESFANRESTLRQEIDSLESELKASPSDAEKKNLQLQLNRLEKEFQLTRDNLENLAAGTDMSVLKDDKPQQFNFQDEILALLEPLIKELKQMTSTVRQKTVLKDEVSIYREQLPVIETIITNVNTLYAETDDNTLLPYLEKMLSGWTDRQDSVQNALQAAELQLQRIKSNEVSVAEASQSYLKNFFQKRGLYLAIAFLLVASILLFSRISHALIIRMVPGYRQTHRSFRIRLLDLSHRGITIILAIIGPMIVFYIAEDWLLLSVGFLLLLAAAWTLRTAIPHYWHQIEIFLNIGSVREGERIFMDGIPWKVQQINFFSILENPTAGISQRIPIDELVDRKSRPVRPEESWFPCKKNDWVILNDGVRGKVTGISQEFVELTERGGAHKTYLTQGFLDLSPRNLSVNFRLKESIGLSYHLQSQSTVHIPEILETFIRHRIETEGYGSDLLNLRVEFEKANDSSLDVVVIADFRGKLAPLYNRLRRAIQRWCVEASTENQWEIPFPQLTIHGQY
ncbi:MAG: hypothetical protein V3W04_09150 [Gammaproteobacteria bacterium]